MNRVVAAFEAMRTALGAAAPNAVAKLHPPARSSALAEMEVTLGRALHADLRALLALHNGQDPSPPLFDNEWLNGTSLDAWSARKELFDAGAVTRGWWDPLWVPVTDSDGNGFHLHLETSEVRYMDNVEGLDQTRRAAGLAELFELVTSLVTSEDYDPDFFETGEPEVWVHLSENLPRG